MPFNLRISILAIAIILTIVIVHVLHKDMIPVKYSLLWGLGVLLLIILSIWPNILVSLASLLGFQTISNMVTGVLFVILLFITISLTVIVSGQKKKITLLVQEVSILKNRVNDIEKKKGDF